MGILDKELAPKYPYNKKSRDKKKKKKVLYPPKQNNWPEYKQRKEK
jgi:hypothetical protein